MLYSYLLKINEEDGQKKGYAGTVWLISVSNRMWDFKLYGKIEESRFIFAVWLASVTRYILLTNDCCNNQQQRSSESYHVWIFLAAFRNLRGREETPRSIRATNKWTSVSVRVERVGHRSATHVRRYRFVCALHVCLWKKLACVCVCACASPASSRPTLIWADGCHGSVSHLLHSGINSIDLDTGWWSTHRLRRRDTEARRYLKQWHYRLAATKFCAWTENPGRLLREMHYLGGFLRFLNELYCLVFSCSRWIHQT